MRIEITRSGGFTGLTRTWSLEVSRTEAEQRWLPLAEAATDGGAEIGAAGGGEAAGADGRSGPGTQRDRFTYRIAVGYMEVEVPESRLQDPWRELIDRARSSAVPAAPPAPAVGGPVGTTPEALPEGTSGGTGGAGAHDAGPGVPSSGDVDPGKPGELL